MDLIAVFTGDSANYHIFQVIDSEHVVGSLYIKKKGVDLPKGLDVSLVTPVRDKELWKHGMNQLLDKSRSGSKAENKLIKTLKNYE